jgi:hypothetical protein
MRLSFRLDDVDRAVADFRLAHGLLLIMQGPEAARAALVSGLGELELPRRRPLLVIDLLAADETAVAERLQGPPSAPSDSAVSGRRAELLRSALSQVQHAGVDAVKPVLNAGRLWRLTWLDEEAARTVAEMAGDGHRDLFLQAVSSPDATTRLLAVSGLAAVGGDVGDEPLTVALDDCSDPVRHRAAVALLNRGRRDCLSRLVALLDSEDVGVRHQAAEALRSATRQQFGFTAYESPEARRKVVDQWTAWVAEHAHTADLKLPVAVHAVELGRTLFVNQKQRQAYELDDGGRQTWTQSDLPNVWSCRGSSDGHRLVTQTNPRCVVEFDAQGNEVWKRVDLPGSPYSAQRLDNGHVLVACNDKKIYEFRRDHTVARVFAVPGLPRWVERLDNGHTLVAVSSPGQVVELDTQGETVWSVNSLSNPVRVQRLPDGGTFVVDGGSRLLQELAPDHRVVWSKSWHTVRQSGNLFHAERLPNRHTLVVDDHGLTEIDPQGRVVRHRADDGLRCVDRY